MEKQSIQLTLKGRKRKEAADCVGTALGATPIYQKAPSYAYAIGTAVIDRETVLSFDESMSEEERNTVLSVLRTSGFLPELTEEPVTPPSPQKTDHLIIQMPLDGFSPEKLDNLTKLVASKATLLQKAIDAEVLPVVLGKDTIDFPWFKIDATPEEIAAYTQLVSKLCDMAKQQQRILATDKPVDNEKYAFRCFLLRLGFIGEEYAESRKILLQNLSGNGSWKSGETKPRQASAKSEVQNTDNTDKPERKSKKEKAQPETPTRQEPPPQPKRRFSFKKLLGGLKMLALD